jgi:membrane-bound lytic murein transglycosylase D
MRTVQQALIRHRDAAVRWVTRLALFSLAGVAVMETWHSPLHLPIRPAAEAVSAPVSASGTTLSLASAAPVAAAPVWDLANISNPRVDSWVQRFTTSLKGEISTALTRGEAYLPMISAKLAERGMPQELAYLPMIESEFRPQARSPVSAVGLWQFMSATARRFGLSVGRNGDERTNPAKATDAALTYLSQLHDRFGSWYLAAAAYNAGPGTIANAMKRVLGRSTGTDADFYMIAPHLPKETREYVPKLIAAARISKEPSRYGLDG